MMISTRISTRANGFGQHLLTMLGGLILFSVTGMASAQMDGGNAKIVVVDLERVVASSNLGRDLQARMDEFGNRARVEGDEIAARANGLRRQITEGINTLPQEQLEAMSQQFEAAAAELQRFQEDKQREGQQMQEQGLRDIEAQLEPIFKAIRDEQGLDLILNRVPGVVVMAGERMDITEQVIERVNALGR